MHALLTPRLGEATWEVQAAAAAKLLGDSHLEQQAGTALPRIVEPGTYQYGRKGQLVLLAPGKHAVNTLRYLCPRNVTGTGGGNAQRCVKLGTQYQVRRSGHAV